MASLAHVLATELDWASLGLYAVLFLAVWLAWTTFMLYGNVAGSRTHVLRLLIGMFGLGVMAASVPGVAHTLLDGGHEERARSPSFAVAYIVTRVYGAQSWRRGEVLLDFPVAQHTFGVLPWVVSLWTHPPVTVALWALGVALDLWLVLVVSGDDMLERYSSRMDQLTARGERARERATGQGGRRGGRPLGEPGIRSRPGGRGRRGGRRGRGRRPRGGGSPGAGAGCAGAQAGAGLHRPRPPAERLGGFVIIVLGEGVVQVVNAASNTVPEAGLFVAGLASFVLLAGMFGLSVLYGFAGVPHLRGDAVRGAGRARPALCRHRGDRDGVGGARVGRRARQRAARHRAALAALRRRGRLLPHRASSSRRGARARGRRAHRCGSPAASSCRCCSGCSAARCRRPCSPV